MHSNVKARVRCGSKLTQFINCSAGVKQGDISSPVLFSLFINELALKVIENGKHGVTFPLDPFELFILLLADDVVLLSETIIGLQTQINSLKDASNTLGLQINMDKSNIVVFRKGGYLSAREKWFYDGKVVNAYKYLGIYLTTRLSFVTTCKDLTSKAKRALLCIIRKLYSLNNRSLSLFLKLFDVQIQPIVQYGSEIWGLDKAAVNCEKLHTFALKKFLGVDIRTPNDFVYGKLDRYPIDINSIGNCLRFWLKLTQMDCQRIPRKAYNMLVNLDEKGKITWVTNVRVCLFQYGFGFVWVNQGVGDVKSFLKMFKERLIDCRWQNWQEHIQESQRFSVYKQFNSNHCVKTYLLEHLDYQLRFLMAKFRLGVSDINVHFYRHRNNSEKDLLCPLCNKHKEDEVHFVLCCPFYENMRRELIAEKYFRNPNTFKFNILMASESTTTTRKLAIYLYKAFKLRKLLISQF